MAIEVPAPVPADPSSLEDLREAAAGCRACDLWERATQTVFGEGAEGATAAQALIDPTIRVTRQHGILFPSAFGPMIAATVHPASILRAPDAAAREAAYAGFVEDLRAVAATSVHTGS